MDEKNKKSNSELVSSIITTHNRDPQTVLRAINSVLSQTYNRIELIVVDDSDFDFPARRGVEDTVREVSEDIVYIKHDVCKGPCAARNTGLSYAKGYYVAFLDDDDEWVLNKIEEQLNGFSDDKTALVYSGITMIDEVRNKKYAGRVLYKSGRVYGDLLEYNFIGSTSNPLIKKECIDEVGQFDTELQSSQDYDLWLRIAKRHSVNYIEKPLLNYHIHHNARISTNLDKRIAGIERINEKYQDDINKENKTWYLRHRDLVALYANKRWKKKALLLWGKCIAKYPWDIVHYLKLLLLIIFGFDSLLYRSHQKMKDTLSILSQKR